MKVLQTILFDPAISSVEGRRWSISGLFQKPQLIDDEAIYEVLHHQNSTPAFDEWLSHTENVKRRQKIVKAIFNYRTKYVC